MLSCHRPFAGFATGAEYYLISLKFFFAEPPGGAKYLASHAGPGPDLIFRPTGGIDTQKAGLALVACVGGARMVAPGPIAAQEFANVEQLARDACALGGHL